MNRDFLKSLSISDENIDKIMAENGKDIEGLKANNATLKTELDAVRGQLNTANNQISEFKDMDVEGIKKTANEWKEKAEKAERDARISIEGVKKDYAIESALGQAKAKNTKAVRALLNLDAISYTESGLVGLDEQLQKVKEENAYLFGDSEDKPTPRVVGPTSGAKGVDGEGHAKANSAFREFMKGN